MFESVPFNEPDNEELTSFQKDESGVERSFGTQQRYQQPVLEQIDEDKYELPNDDESSLMKTFKSQNALKEPEEVKEMVLQDLHEEAKIEPQQQLPTDPGRNQVQTELQET